MLKIIDEFIDYLRCNADIKNVINPENTYTTIDVIEINDLKEALENYILRKE